MALPLEGLRILDLTRLLPGGYATLLLADLGADVVKVEEPGRGDYIRWMPPMVGEHSAAHIALNRNKRSICLDLKSDAGRDLFLHLVPSFDVIVESFRPGVMDRLGLGWPVLSKVHDRIVVCAISGYGQDGPRASEAGHDIDYIAYAGVLSTTGEEGRRPVVPGVQIGDFGGGAMAAVIAILTALRVRDQTGRGEFCDVSMTDGVASWLSIHAAQHVATNEVPQRELMPLSGAYPCYRVYPAADGHLAVGALEPRFWTELCSALGRPDLAGDGYATGERRRDVIDQLEDIFSRHTRAEWVARLAGRDVCVAPVNDLEEALADPQLRHRGMFFESDVAGSAWTHVATPIRVGAAAPELRRPPPRLGEHARDVLAEAAVAADDATLRSAGAL